MTQLIVAGTATTADVMADVTFSAGTIYNGQGGIIRQAATSISPGATYGSGNLFVQVPTGAYLVAGSSGKPEVTLTTAKLQAADTNLRDWNILSGMSIMGVVGTAVKSIKVVQLMPNNADMPWPSEIAYYANNMTPYTAYVLSIRATSATSAYASDQGVAVLTRNTNSQGAFNDSMILRNIPSGPQINTSTMTAKNTGAQNNYTFNLTMIQA